MDRLNIIATLLTVLSTFTLLSQVEKVTINENMNVKERDETSPIGDEGSPNGNVRD